MTFEAECRQSAQNLGDAIQEVLKRRKENDDQIDVEDLTCLRRGDRDCTDPACIGVLRSEMRQNELWGGTE